MPENLLLTHWLAEILNAAHIMYYQTVIDLKLLLSAKHNNPDPNSL